MDKKDCWSVFSVECQVLSNRPSVIIWSCRRACALHCFYAILQFHDLLKMYNHAKIHVLFKGRKRIFYLRNGLNVVNAIWNTLCKVLIVKATRSYSSWCSMADIQWCVWKYKKWAMAEIAHKDSMTQIILTQRNCGLWWGKKGTIAPLLLELTFNWGR